MFRSFRDAAFPFRHAMPAWLTMMAAIGAGILLASRQYALTWGALAVLLVVCVVTVNHRLAVTMWLFILFALFDLVGYSSLFTLWIRIGLADGIILLTALIIPKLLFGKSESRRLESPLTGLLLVNLAYGFVAAAVGLLVGNQFNDVMGDFRRFSVYPLAALAMTLFSLEKPDYARLARLLGIALLIIGCITVFRVVTNQTWDEDQFGPAGQFRAVGYFTGAIALMGLGVFYGQLLARQCSRRWLQMLLIGIALGVALLSGYRLLWLLALIVPIATHCFYSRTTARLQAVIGSAVLTALLSVSITILVRVLVPSAFSLLEQRFQIGILAFDPQTDERYYAWRTAWAEFRSSPIIGVGAGDRLYFMTRSSLGDYYEKLGTTHNIFFALLYKTGIVGVGLFTLIQVCIFWYVWSRLPSLEGHIRGPVSGMLAGYLASLSTGMLQPTLESPGAIVALYSWAGLMLGIVRIYSRREPGGARDSSARRGIQ